jgi:hypothetical protein
MNGLLSRAALLATLTALVGTTGGSLWAQGNPVADAQRKIGRIDIALEALESQFEMARSNYQEEKRRDRLEELRQATDPSYQRPFSVGRLSGKLGMISTQYGVLGRIGQLVILKLRLAQVLPLEDQLQIVNEELAKARNRQARLNSATTLAQVTMLMNVQTRLRLRMQQGPR